MKNRTIISLLSIFCFLNFTEQQLVASSNFLAQSNTVTMQSSTQSIDLGVLTSQAHQITLDLQRQIAQNLLCSRVDRRVCVLRRSDEAEDVSHEKQQNLGCKGYFQKICMMILLMLVSLPSGLLFTSDDRLSRITAQNSNIDASLIQQRNLVLADIQRKYPQLKPVGNRVLRPTATNQRIVQHDLPLVESIEELSSCCVVVPHNVRALPVTYGTNIAGNLLAIGIAYFSPNVVTAGIVAGGVGCVGGCLEAHSTDHTYFTPNQHAWHNNLSTGYVADQVTGSIGSCFAFPVVNAAAVAAPIGYTCGIGAGLAVRSCMAQRSQIIPNQTQQRIDR